MYSIFDRERNISSSPTIVTEVMGIKNKGLYLEKRDLFGRHQVIKYSYDNSDYKKEESFNYNPMLLSAEKNSVYKDEVIDNLENIIGKYYDADSEERKKPYAASLFKVDADKINEREEIIEIKGLEKLQQDNGVIGKRLFHQTLVGRGVTDHTHYMDQVLAKTSIYKKSDIIERVEKLKTEEKVWSYYKTFYWTILNYVTAYRNLSTGMFENKKEEKTTKENLIYEGSKKVLSYAGEFAKGIPILGSIVNIIDKAVDGVSEEIKEYQYENRKNAINNVFILSNNEVAFEDDLNLLIAKLALEVTEKKKDDILHPKEKSKLEKVQGMGQKVYEIYEKVSEWKKTLVEGTKDLILDKIEKKVDLEVSDLAVEDVIKLLTCVYKNSDKIKKDKDLCKQLCDTVINGKIISADDTTLEEKLTCRNIHDKCCTIFAVPEIKYDNELLNNRELFNKVASIVGGNKLLDLGSSISKELINEAVENNNIELLLGAIMSLEPLESTPLSRMAYSSVNQYENMVTQILENNQSKNIGVETAKAIEIDYVLENVTAISEESISKQSISMELKVYNSSEHSYMEGSEVVKAISERSEEVSAVMLRNASNYNNKLEGISVTQWFIDKAKVADDVLGNYIVRYLGINKYQEMQKLVNKYGITMEGRNINISNDNELKQVYRKVAVKTHPDKNPDNIERKADFNKAKELTTIDDSTYNKIKLHNLASKVDQAYQFTNGLKAVTDGMKLVREPNTDNFFKFGVDIGYAIEKTMGYNIGMKYIAPANVMYQLLYEGNYSDAMKSGLFMVGYMLPDVVMTTCPAIGLTMKGVILAKSIYDVVPNFYNETNYLLGNKELDISSVSDEYTTDVIM